MFLHDESTAHLAHKTTSHLDKRDSLYENTDQKNSCDSDQNKKNLKGYIQLINGHYQLPPPPPPKPPPEDPPPPEELLDGELTIVL